MSGFEDSLSAPRPGQGPGRGGALVATGQGELHSPGPGSQTLTRSGACPRMQALAPLLPSTVLPGQAESSATAYPPIPPPPPHPVLIKKKKKKSFSSPHSRFSLRQRGLQAWENVEQEPASHQQPQGISEGRSVTPTSLRDPP